jgi:hypothetical protein
MLNCVALILLCQTFAAIMLKAGAAHSCHFYVVLTDDGVPSYYLI